MHNDNADRENLISRSLLMHTDNADRENLISRSLLMHTDNAFLSDQVYVIIPTMLDLVPSVLSHEVAP
jgi:hypothetical protein